MLPNKKKIKNTLHCYTFDNINDVRLSLLQKCKVTQSIGPQNKGGPATWATNTRV